MQIRELEERDNKRLEQIIKQSLESFNLDIPGTAYFDPHIGELAQFYKAQTGAKYWVAVNEQDEVIGGIGVAPFGEDKEICELQKLYIIPEAQGRGLSRKLMEKALDFARKHYRYCYLETLEKLRTANLLYSKTGFRKLEKALDESEHNACDTWYMKELT